MEVLENWSDDIPPTMSGLGVDPKFQAARKALLPKGVSVHSWIERRIGGEVEIAQGEGCKEFFVGHAFTSQ